MSSNIVLFDMDGTLTEVRKEITQEMISLMSILSSVAKIGIVTGSDYDYLVDQCKDLWSSNSNIDPRRIVLMPCNGTKLYKWSQSRGSYVIKHENDMRKELGTDEYNDLLCSLVSHQLIIIAQNSIPYSGTFFQYRGSMLNWCPIGRSASESERRIWIELDQDKKIREFWLSHLEERFEKENIPLSVALGGSTSIDIYPRGWDKTYSLRHIKKHVPWFVGDKCFKGGNDWTLYKALSENDRAFSTSSPEETMSIVHNIIKKIEASDARR